MATAILNISRSKSEPVVDAIIRRVERYRVRTHLREVEKWLRAKDVSHLSEDARVKRETHLNNLHTYWKAGDFPKNTDFAYAYVPYFKDKAGTPCAMAYLMEQDGEVGLVEDIHKNDNYVRIDDIKSGPAYSWIAASGLTQNEAAHIQPQYAGWPGMYHEPTLFEKIIKLAPFLVGIITFIIFERIAYKIATWIAAGDVKKRRMVFFYLTFNSIIFSIALSLFSLLVLDIVR